MPESSGLEEFRAALERLSDPVLIARKKEIVRVREVVLARREKRRTLLELESGRSVEARGGFTALARQLGSRFLRLGNEWILDVDRIEAVSGGEERQVGGSVAKALYRLHLSRWPTAIEIPRRLEGAVRKRLGMRTLDHPTPTLPTAKDLRKYGLVDFGEAEFAGLDPGDGGSGAALKAFRLKWELGRWPLARIFEHFAIAGQPGRIDERRFVRNMVWQLFRWVSRGIRPQYAGNVRSLWYDVEAAVDRHEGLSMTVSGDTYSNLLIEMTSEEKLFRYRDIGFVDMRAVYRRVGRERPGLVLMCEKEGLFPQAWSLARPYGMSVVSTKGQASRIMIEYLLQELAGEAEPRYWGAPEGAEGGEEAGAPEAPRPTVDFARDWVHVFAVCDYDWAGTAIVENFARLVAYESGSKRVVLHRLVARDLLTEEDLEYARAKVAQYRIEGGVRVPAKKVKKKALEKAYDWWVAQGRNPRLHTSAKDEKGKTVYTLWKVIANKMDWEAIAARLEARIRPILEGRWDGTTGERIEGGAFVPGVPVDEGVGEKAGPLASVGRPGRRRRAGRIGWGGEVRPGAAELGWDPYERLFPFEEGELD